MLSSPTRPSLDRQQSYENTTPCPPYNLSQEDVLTPQKSAAVIMAPLPSSIPPAVAEEDEVWVEFDRIQDPQTLKEKFYEQHQHMRAQLDMAGRFGLSLQQDVEQLQDAHVHSYTQIQSLQNENAMLKNRASHVMDLSSQLSGSEHEVQTLTTHNESLQRELDGCRKDLKSFRRELDGLVEQMSDMGTEVLDAKTKVSVYSRRLTEVEQELNATKELNVDLQVQLQSALDKQKQSQSSTAQVVKNIQSDLGKVLSDSGTIRSTLEELENRQVKCEDKVVEMISNTKEYAHLLEEAQETIQTLRTESDMEGRGWQHSPTTANWGYQARKSSGLLSTLSLEGDRREFSPHELEPAAAWDHDQDHNGENSSGGAQSLGMELGLGMTIHTDDWDHSQNALETQPKDVNISSPPSTPVSYFCSAADSKHLTPATSPLAPSALLSGRGSQPIPQQAPQHHQAQQQQPVQKQQQPTPPMIHVPRKLSSASVSLTSELQQRLEEHNILQTVLALPLSAAGTGSSRPPWNPSVALENELPNLIHQQSPLHQRSRSNSRAASISSRSSSRSLSRANLLQLAASPSSSSFRNGSSSSSTSSVTQQLLLQQQQHQYPHGMMPSPQTSPHLIQNTSSLMDAISAQQGRSIHSSISSGNKQLNNSGSRPRSRTTATTVERNPNPGLKSFLSSSSSSSDLSNVVTKTKAKTQGSSLPSFNASAANRSSSARASSSNYQNATNSSTNRGRGASVVSHGSGSNSPVTVAEKTKPVQRLRTSSTTSLNTYKEQARRPTPTTAAGTKVVPGSSSPTMRGTGGPVRETGTMVAEGEGSVRSAVPSSPRPNSANRSSPSSSPTPYLDSIKELPSSDLQDSKASAKIPKDNILILTSSTE